MKKSITTKVTKFYLKCMALQQEHAVLLSELQQEQSNAESKFQEVEAKYDATDEPSDALIDRYDKLQEEFDEIDDLYQTFSDASIGDVMETIEPYVELPEEYKQPKLASVPKPVNELYVHVTKRQFIKQSGTHVLFMELWTDVNPFPAPFVVYWSDKENKWEEHEGRLPWLGGGNLYKQWMTHSQSLFSQLYNDKQDITATFTRESE